MMNIVQRNFVSAEQPSAAQTQSANTPGQEPQEPPPGADKTGPITRLKSRPKEEIDWACNLDLTMTRTQAIAEIKNRLGIDLRWPTTYSRFLQWRQKQQRQSGLAARLDKFRQFEKESDPSAGFATIEAAGAILFLEQAVISRDVSTFTELVQLRLREKSLALQEKKLDLALKRMELEKAGQHNPRPVVQKTKEESPQAPAPDAPRGPESPPANGCSSGRWEADKTPEKHNEPARETCGKTQLCAETHDFRAPSLSCPPAPANGTSHRTQPPGFPRCEPGSSNGIDFPD